MITEITMEIMLRVVFPILTVPPPSFLAAPFNHIFPLKAIVTIIIPATFDRQHMQGIGAVESAFGTFR